MPLSYHPLVEISFFVYFYDEFLYTRVCIRSKYSFQQKVVIGRAGFVNFIIIIAEDDFTRSCKAPSSVLFERKKESQFNFPILATND